MQREVAVVIWSRAEQPIRQQHGNLRKYCLHNLHLIMRESYVITPIFFHYNLKRGLHISSLSSKN